MSYINYMKAAYYNKELKNKPVSFKVTESDYEKLIKIVGPHINLSSIFRELIQSFIEKNLKKAA